MKRNLLLFSLLVSLQFVNAQQTCDTALPITAGIHLVNAVDGSQVPQPLCEDQYGQVPEEDNPAGKWYVYTPTGNFTVTVTSDLPENNPLRDTRFHVYSGTCSTLLCEGGDDDTGAGLSSIGSFNVSVGTTYYIAWDNRWTSNGFSFRLTEAPILANPCLTATPVTNGITTVASIDGGNVVTSCSTASAAKWYSYTAANNSNLTVTSDLAQNICKNQAH